MMVALTGVSYAGITPPGGGGHGSGHAPEMTDVAVVLAGLTSLGGYLAIRRRINRQK
jgi:hypothetical protein